MAWLHAGVIYGIKAQLETGIDIQAWLETGMTLRRDWRLTVTLSTVAFRYGIKS